MSKMHVAVFYAVYDNKLTQTLLSKQFSRVYEWGRNNTFNPVRIILLSRKKKWKEFSVKSELVKLKIRRK